MTFVTHPAPPHTRLAERYATGAWLSPPLMTFAALAMIGGTVASLGFLILTADGTVDRLGRPIGTDFSSFWTAGRMALEGQAVAAYDWTAHAAMQRQTHGVDLYFPWSYPPVFLLVASLFALLPYLPAFFAWQAVTFSAALAVTWAILPRPQALLVAAGFPAVLICWGHGQTGFLTAALLAGGALALPRSQALAGILFGLLIYKPQFGLLIPIYLIVQGRWTAIATAAVTVAAACALPLALWGWPVWQAFADSLAVTRALVFETGDTGFEKFQSAFAWVRLWGLPLAAAYAAQAVTAGIVVIACVLVWRSRAPVRLKSAALLVGTLLVPPYMLDYDLVVFGMALLLLVAHGIGDGFYRWEKTFLAWCWLMPLVARTVTGATLMPLGFITLAAAFALIVVKARRPGQLGMSNARVSARC